MISNEEERQLWRFTDLLLCWFSSTRAWVLRASVIMVEVVPHLGVARGRRVTPAGHGLFIALMEYGRLLSAGLVLEFCRLTRKKKGISTGKLVYLLSQCMWLLRSMQTIFRASVSQSQTQWHGDIQTLILVMYKYWWHAKRWQNRNYLLKYTARVTTSTRIQLPSTQETTTTIRRESANTHTQTWWGFHWPHCKGVRFGAGRSLSLQLNPARPNGHLKGTRRLKGHPVRVRRRIHQVELHQRHATVKRSILTAHTRNPLPSVHLDTLWRGTKEFRLNSHCVFHQWRKDLLPHIMTDVALPLPINSICHSSC